MMKEWAEWKRRNGVGEKAAKMKDGLRLAEHGEPAAPDGTALFNEKATSLYEPEQLETFGASFESWMWENISSPDVMGPLLDIILTPVGKTPKFSDMAERLAFTSEEETQTWEALSFFGKSAAGITEKRPKSGESSKSKPEESAATNPSPGPR
jgi:hypothetical protein